MGKVDMFNFKTVVNNLELKLPRKVDKWLMAEFVWLSYSKQDLLRLNRVRLHQQFVFLLDVLCAKGKNIDQRYLIERDRLERWSEWKFPTEWPPVRDFKLWRKALYQIASQGRVRDRLGSFVEEGHNIWEWRYKPIEDLLLRVTMEGIQQYRPSQLPWFANMPNRYSPAEDPDDEDDMPLGNVATVRTTDPYIWSITGHSDCAPSKPQSSDFREVLLDWEHTLLWEDFCMVGDAGWIADAIRDNTLITVTDGSYMKEIHPHLCSAAYILEYSLGRGRIVGAFP